VQQSQIYDIWRVLGQPRDVAEAEIRATCRTVYLGEHEALTRILGRYKMYVDTRDIGIASHLMMEGYWEMWVTEAMMRLLRRGAVVADVGANLGYFTLLMADLTGAEGHVLSFEPNPELARRLRKSIDVNGFAGFTDFYPCGLAEEEGWALMEVRNDQPGGGRTIPVHEHEREPEPEPEPEPELEDEEPAAPAPEVEAEPSLEPAGIVAAFKRFWRGAPPPGASAAVAEEPEEEPEEEAVDEGEAVDDEPAEPAEWTPPEGAVRLLRFDELPRAREVEFMKIDVEGFEPQVWAGMTGRLENYDLPLTIFMEFTIERLEDPRGFLQRILDWGFSLEIITFRDGVRAITPDELFAGPHNIDHMLVFRREARGTGMEDGD
jgi:FkbM family methyltransferase